MAPLGSTRLALVAGNLVHLAVLLWAMGRLGRRLDSPLAPLLVLLCPGVFGTLVRFEPNFANIAWTAAGLACLVESRGGASRRWMLGWGVALGLGLMMDRLSVAFFLVPPLLVLAWRSWRAGRQALVACAVNLVMAVGVTLMLTVAYYREFFMRHSAELLSQAPVGEIDSAGTLQVQEGAPGPLWYLVSLLESQAGLVLGAVLLVGLVGNLRGGRALLVSCVAFGLGFFSLVAKKQAFYTLPILVPLAVLVGRRRSLAVLGVVGGTWNLASVGLGLVPGPPHLFASWVSTPYVVARPPTHDQWPLEEAWRVLEPAPGSVIVFSEDQSLYEGFLVLAVREAFPLAGVRGVTLDPHGSYESMADAEAFVWVSRGGEGWPSRAAVQRELEGDHYVLDDLPPVWQTVIDTKSVFEEVGRWSIADGSLVVFRSTVSGDP
jgi:hypothetical protein